MARREFETLTPQMFYILLALNKPKHGYEVMQDVKKMTGGKINIGAGTLYTLFPRFLNDGYIRLVEEVDRKKVYVITKLGKKKLQSEVQRMKMMIENYDFIMEDNDEI